MQYPHEALVPKRLNKPKFTIYFYGINSDSLNYAITGTHSTLDIRGSNGKCTFNNFKYLTVTCMVNIL